MTSVPSLNVTPATTLGNRFSPFSLRQVLAAAMTSLKTISRAVLGDKAPFVRTVRCRTVAKTGLDGVRRPQMIPVLGRHLEKCQQRVAVPNQALGRLGVLGPVLLDENRDGRLGRPSRWRRRDLADVGLHSALHGLRHLVEQVRGLVQPAPLVAGAGSTSSRAFQKPRAPSPTAISGEMARPRRFTSTSSSRQLWALSRTPTWKPTNSSSALRRGADEDQHALGLVLHPGLQVDPVGPDVDVVSGRQVPPLPALVLGLPFGREAHHDRGRQVRVRPGPEAPTGLPGSRRSRCRAGTASATGHRGCASAAPSAAGLPSPESDALATFVGPTVPDLGRATATAPIPVCTSRSGPCPCRTRRARPSGSFRSARSARKASTSSSTAWARSWWAPARQHLRQRIVGMIGLTKPHDVAILIHGVSLSPERFWQAWTPASIRRLSQPSSPNFPHSSGCSALRRCSTV